MMHQIEYRWVPVKDLSPVASSMSPKLTSGWDPLIRPWVRHPAAGERSESVCYQVLTPEVAALAWRYWDPQVTEREDGTLGRPLFSRVLIGPPGLLTPNLAVLLCRAGLPELAGPRPAQFDIGEGLSPFHPGELAGLAAAAAGELDQAAAQEKGLQQVVAAALSDPDTPLGIQLRDPYIFYPLRTAPQSLLLWGMWRTAEPLLGTGRRGWSFSTFELPMGKQDLSSLPAIVFRRTQSASGPPVNSRPEIRVRPGDPSPATDTPGSDVTELARWLVEEYRQAGGDGLRQLIAACGAGQPLEARLGILLEKLRTKHSPMRKSGPATATVPVRARPGPADVGERTASESPPVEDREHAALQGASQHERTPDYWDDDQLPDSSDYWPTAQAHEAADHRDAALAPDASGEAEESAPPDGLEDQAGRQAAASGPGLPAPGGPRPTAAGSRSATVPWYEQQGALQAGRVRSYPVDTLFKELEREQTDKNFQLILDNLLGASPEFDERVAVRRQMPRADWYLAALKRHGGQDYVHVLAGIFFVFVLPDLDRPILASQLSEWVRKGPPEVTAALLMAAKAADKRRSGNKKFQLMTAALGEAALQKLLELSQIPFDWPPASRGAGTGNHSRPGFFTKILRSLHLIEDPAADLSPPGGVGGTPDA